MNTATVTFRPVRDDDVATLTAFSRTSSSEDGPGSTQTEDDIRRWIGARESGPIYIVECDGIAVGSAHWEMHGSEQIDAGGWVEPEHRGRGIGTQILRWLIEQSREVDGVRALHTWAAATRADALELFTAHGFVHDRSFFRMAHTAPASIEEPAWPAGIALRRLDGDDAIATAVAAYNGSFIDHWNFVPTDEVDMRFRFDDPREDPALWFFAYDAETLAGFCLCTFDAGTTTPRGHLGPIGTMRSHRGIGLGRALLRHGVRALAARGAEEVQLGVDSQNPSGAVRLYSSDGFERVREGRVYRLDL